LAEISGKLGSFLGEADLFEDCEGVH